MAGIRRKSTQSGKRCFQPRDHRVESRHQIGEVRRFLAQRESAMQAAPIGDRCHLGRDFSELALSSAEKDKCPDCRADDDERHDHQGIDHVLARHRGCTRGDRS